MSLRYKTKRLTVIFTDKLGRKYYKVFQPDPVYHEIFGFFNKKEVLIIQPSAMENCNRAKLESFIGKLPEYVIFNREVLKKEDIRNISIDEEEIELESVEMVPDRW